MSFDINLAPRLYLNNLPTPLAEMKNLSKLFNGPTLYIKRDDMTGLGFGGNKTRKLEFLLGEAKQQQCDTIITGGAIQSNHCRQTAAAAAMAGFECHLALGGYQPEQVNGNLLLDYLFGSTIHWCGEKRKGELLPDIALELRAKGRKPYIIPYGGSNVTGALGFVSAIMELKEQMTRHGLTIDYIVFPSSSGGTHAGISTGLDLYQVASKAIGIAIDKGLPGETPYPDLLVQLANQLSIQLELNKTYSSGDFILRQEYLGEGYGILNDTDREAIKLVARNEGILLDPVYSGRAMGGLLDMIRNKEFKSNENVLFWHTGGTPALFEYAKELISI